MLSVGGTVSTLKVTLPCVAAFPSLSAQSTLITLFPSLSGVGGVYEHLYPPSIGVFVIPVCYLSSTINCNTNRILINTTCLHLSLPM